MLGDYSGITDTVIVIPDEAPEGLCYGLANMEGHEISGPSYRRQPHSELSWTDQGFPAGFRLTWRPTEPGEIWAFNNCFVYMSEDAEEAEGFMTLDRVIVLYGSLQGSFSYRLVPQSTI